MSVLLIGALTSMRYQIELKISAMKSSIYSSSADIIGDIFLLVFTCRIILHTLRSKCIEYLRYDVVQPAKEPHIKSTGVRKNENARENPTIYGR